MRPTPSSSYLFASRLHSLVISPASHISALILLCGSYIQGPLMKIVDFAGAIDEMAHFGLEPAPVIAVLVILFELTASTMVICGLFRWMAAFALAAFTLVATFLALRFWEMEPGFTRTTTINAFFEHLGLVGAFLLVATMDLTGSIGHERAKP